MKKIILCLTTIILFANCEGNKKQANQKEAIQAEILIPAKPILSEVTQYFATFEPSEETTMILDKSKFEESFNPARTMDIAPTIINFDSVKVAAIILKKTARDTRIELKEAKITDRTLVIEYGIKIEGEDRSFTIVPVKLFEFSVNLDIDSISFINNEIVRTYSK